MTRTKTDKDSKSSSEKKKPLKGFFEFISKYSIIGMALGIIIGQTTKDTVNALVKGVITPTIQLLLPNTELQDMVLTVRNAEFQVGLFLNAVIEMLIIMALLYLVIGVLMKRSDLLEK